MASIFTPAINTFVWLIVGFIIGFVVFEVLSDTDDGSVIPCPDELAATRDSLDRARDSLTRAFVISDPGPVHSDLDPLKAKELMNNYAGSAFATISNYQGMNLDFDHLEQIIRYHMALEGTGHRGFRILQGLTDPASTSEADIRQIIVPLNSDGSASMPTDVVWSFDPNDKFELPCPTMCD